MRRDGNEHRVDCPGVTEWVEIEVEQRVEQRMESRHKMDEQRKSGGVNCVRVGLLMKDNSGSQYMSAI